MKRYITLYNAIKKCDIVRLKKEIEKTFEYDEENKLSSTYVTLVFIGELLTLKPLRTKKKTILFYEKIDGHADTTCIEYDELTNIQCEFYDIKELSKKSIDELNNLVTKLDNIIPFEFCSYMLVPTRKILSYLIPYSLIEKYSIEEIVASSLHELSFFGINVNKIDKRKNSFLDIPKSNMKKYQLENAIDFPVDTNHSFKTSVLSSEECVTRITQLYTKIDLINKIIKDIQIQEQF